MSTFSIVLRILLCAVFAYAIGSVSFAVIFSKAFAHRDVREMVEDIGERWADRYAYSFRLNPRDKEVVRKTYPELRDEIRALSMAFINHGFAGKHITLIGKYSYNWVLTYYASMCTASVLIPLDKDWTAADLTATAQRADTEVLIVDKSIEAKGREIAEALGLELLITETDVTELVEEGRPLFEQNSAPYYETEIDPRAMALLVFTSGTTGKGKGVMLCQGGITWDLADVVQYIDFSKKTIGVLPPHHTYCSSVSIYGQNSVGIEVYISSGLSAISKEIQEQKPGHIVLVPLYVETFYRKIQSSLEKQGKTKLVYRMIKVSNFLRKLGIDLRKKLFGKITEAFGGNLDHLVCGGAAINQDIIDFFDGIGITILNGYGITECAPLISANYPGENRVGSVGKPVAYMDVRIDNGEIVVIKYGGIGLFDQNDAAVGLHDKAFPAQIHAGGNEKNNKCSNKRTYFFDDIFKFHDLTSLLDYYR